jgi:PBP1b-binding outer membrane lipoprotein LpoB
VPAMKNIMENWDRFLQEELDACPQQPVDLDTFLTGLEIAAMDPAVQKEKIEQLKTQQDKVDKLNNILNVVGLVGSIPAVAASGGGALGAAVVGVFATIINNVQQKKTDAKTKSLLSLLCIDSALLDTIDDNIEKLYWSNSGIQDELEKYISAARANPQPDPMPDFTQHLVTWLNTGGDSPYAQQGTAGLDTDIVMRK